VNALGVFFHDEYLAEYWVIEDCASDIYYMTDEFGNEIIFRILSLAVSDEAGIVAICNLKFNGFVKKIKKLLLP
jgi:hypothetical protein